jgi:hypothetical protein
MAQAKDFVLRVHSKQYKNRTYYEYLIKIPAEVLAKLDKSQWKRGAKLSIMTDGQQLQIVPIPWKT